MTATVNLVRKRIEYTNLMLNSVTTPSQRAHIEEQFQNATADALKQIGCVAVGQAATSCMLHCGLAAAAAAAASLSLPPSRTAPRRP